MSGGDVCLEKIEIVIMKLLRLFFSESMNADIVLFCGSSVKIECEKKGNLVSLQTFISTVQFSIVFEQVYVQFQTAARVGSIHKLQYLIHELLIDHFDGVQHKQFNLLEYRLSKFHCR